MKGNLAIEITLDMGKERTQREEPTGLEALFAGRGRKGEDGIHLTIVAPMEDKAEVDELLSVLGEFTRNARLLNSRRVGQANVC